MRIAFVTAGAAGMYCGSCMRDNTLVAALRRLGHDALLIPTYTPIRTDETDVSEKRVFFGGINVYLQQYSRFFRHTPWLFDQLLDLPRLLRWASRFAARTQYSDLGELTVSVLLGRDGKQRKEVAKLSAWLAAEIKPQIVLFSNALLSGLIPEIKKVIAAPILVTLQGDDIFLDALPEADRKRCIELIRRNGEHVAGYICTSRFYADHMAEYLGISREKMHVVYPGLNLDGHGGPRAAQRDGPQVIGYFARICPEKGFHNVVDAFIELRKMPHCPPCTLRASGWLGDNNREFFDCQVKKLKAAGLADAFDYVDSPGHGDKVKFLRSVDVISVPTSYKEPKGLYVLEAWANGIPVVNPRHGAFPELIDSTGGGLLVPPNDPVALAVGLKRMLEDHEFRESAGRAGEAAVRDRFTADVMARETMAVLRKYAKDEPHSPTLGS